MSDSLSPAAVSVLEALRRAGATAEYRAVTDARLADSTGLPERDIIDAARELLDAGVLVLAAGRGRWIGTVPEAIAYCERLEQRAKDIFGRVAAVRRGIEIHRRRAAEPGRQELLFGIEPVPRSGRSSFEPGLT